MNSKDIKDMQTAIAKLQKDIVKLGKEGITRQDRHSKDLSEIKTAIIEAHEKEKKELKDKIKMHELYIGELDNSLKRKDAEIAEFKKNQKP